MSFLPRQKKFPGNWIPALIPENCSDREQRCDRRRLPSGRNNAGLCSGNFPEKETAQQLADRLRLLPVPIVSHIKNDRVLLEMRTISEEEKREFTAELKEALDEK